MKNLYLHLGQDTVVKTKDIIGIFDLEKATVSKISREYIAGMQKRGNIINVSMEMPKSFTVCTDTKRKTSVYISQLSSSTLLKRSKSMQSAF